MGPRSLSQDLQIVGLNVNTSCIKQVGESLGTQRTVRVALPCYLLGRDRSPSGPCPRWTDLYGVPCPLTLALSEKSPHLGGAQARLGLPKNPDVAR